MHKQDLHADIDAFQVFIDSMMITLGYFTAKGIYLLITSIKLGSYHFGVSVIFGVIFMLLMLSNQMYSIKNFYYLDKIFKKVLISSLIASATVIAVIILGRYFSISHFFFIIYVVCSGVFVFLSRICLNIMRKNLGNCFARVLFIGNEDMYAKYMRNIKKTAIKIKVERNLEPESILFKNENLLEHFIISSGINEVVIAKVKDENQDESIASTLRLCEDMGITVHVLLETYEMENSKSFVSNVGNVPVITYHNTSIDKMQLFFKSVMDMVGALLALVLLSPIFLFTAIAIKLDSKGPVLFTQIRVGRNGKKFKMYKFRSMYENADKLKEKLQSQNEIKGGFMFKMENDPRVTRVGKFIRKTSIDELPQIINVLRREMSLVGTRPPTVDELEKYNRKHHRRLSIMPGITGMWQVNGRSDIHDFDKVVEQDIKYIEEWSIGLDMKLILKTLTAVITGIGAR